MREKRNARRYRLSNPVELDHEIGTTIDISSNGIFFESASNESNHAGDLIRFAVFADTTPDEPVVRLNCLGRITRVESRGRHQRIGARIERAFVSRRR